MGTSTSDDDIPNSTRTIGRPVDTTTTREQVHGRPLSDYEMDCSSSSVFRLSSPAFHPLGAFAGQEEGKSGDCNFCYGCIADKLVINIYCLSCAH